jgi:hypothetical protein
VDQSTEPIATSDSKREHLMQRPTSTWRHPSILIVMLYAVRDEEAWSLAWNQTWWRTQVSNGAAICI